jgi:PAS domain S-box-containing protein
MTPYAAFGVSVLAVAWIIYLSGFRFARRLLLIQGVIALTLTIMVLTGYFLRFSFPFEQFIIPSDESPFLLNLTYMFLLNFLIQVLTYWSPKTKQLINASLAIILFMAILSVFGQLYNQTGIQQEAILIPMPPSAIISFLVLALVIFAHTNSMERLYLNGKIIVSFMLLFVAISGANAVVYKNINQTTDLSNRINDTRHVLTEAYNVDLYLGNALADIQAYNTSGDPDYIAAYQTNKQAYISAFTQLQNRTSSDAHTSNVQQSVQAVNQLGMHILELGDSVMLQQSDQANSQMQTKVQAATDSLTQEMNTYMEQVLDQVKAISLVYTSQLNRLTEQESSGNRGIVLGVSITSSLSLLLIIFTPLFVRQTIQQLSTTEQQLKNSNRLLSDEKSRAETVLAGISDGLFAVDKNEVIILFNQAAVDITGIKKDDALGQTYHTVLRFHAPSDPESGLDFLNNALRGATVHLSHRVTLHGKKKEIDIQVSASPIKDKSGTVTGAIVVFRDRSSEQALENAKDEFVSLASHQLRTPATATKQFLAMFLQGYAGKINSQQRIFLEQAYDNNELGINIIENLLNVTRLESDKLKLNNERIDLNQFLRTAVVQHDSLASKSNQKIHLIIPTKTVFIKADVSLLEMAIDNLITNALKYSGEKSIVTVRLSAGDHPTVSVKDTGIGINKEDLHKIFERFTRLEDHQKQHVSGTGIGLYLVKKITQQLHATIKVESEYGKGSTFILTFKAVG